ncbi:MAG: hypothetical protein AAGD01_07860 [Acidobacteriota bacterium]
MTLAICGCHIDSEPGVENAKKEPARRGASLLRDAIGLDQLDKAVTELRAASGNNASIALKLIISTDDTVRSCEGHQPHELTDLEEAKLCKAAKSIRFKARPEEIEYNLNIGLSQLH